MSEIISPTKKFMWILMEEFTNLAMYPIPIDTSLVKSIVADEDAYVLRVPSIPDLAQLWPGTTVNILPKKGHVEAYFSSHSLFRETIRQALLNAEKRKRPVADIIDKT